MATGDLTSIANLRSWLQLSGTSDDALLERLISAASAFIRSFISRDIISTAYADTLDGKDTAQILFPNYPVTAVASVTIDGVSIPLRTDPSGVGYVFSKTALSLVGYRFCRGFQNVVVQYTAGFVSVPLDIEQACLELIGLKYKGRDRIGQQSKIIGGETVSFFIGDMPKEVKTILQTYQKVVPI